MKAIQKLVLLGLVSTLTASGGSLLNAAETVARPAATKPAKSSLSGKVVAVDHARKSIAVQINKKVYTFKLSKEITVRVNNQTVPLSSLAPGQTISLIARRSASGKFEIVALNIQSSPEQVVAAGGPRSSGETTKGASQTTPGQALSLPAPFRTEPNPANIAGNVISPN